MAAFRRRLRDIEKVDICGSCRFWRIRETGLVGECRRFPPVLNGATSVFPETRDADWCGEWATLELISR